MCQAQLQVTGMRQAQLQVTGVGDAACLLAFCRCPYSVAKRLQWRELMSCAVGSYTQTDTP